VAAAPQGSVARLALDDYYRDLSRLPLDARGERDFDRLEALDADLLEAHLLDLKGGRPAAAPVYDFRTHTRVAGRVRSVAPAPLVVVDGVLLFAHARLRDLLDLRIFVDAPDDLRLVRRVRRDCAERGRTPDGVLAQYEASVRPAHEALVAPSRAHAHLVVPGEAAAFDRVAAWLAAWARAGRAGPASA
jgi:uridine kinase